MALLKSIHFPTLFMIFYCWQLSVSKILILDLLKEYIYKYQYCTPILEKRSFIS